MSQTPVTNRLAHETSPYLRQHADNPVHWQPWDPQALALARETGKPILLSIGYSACHWCHVMAHESFEDRATADRMNALFVNIKVDREERPDLDQIYQKAHLLIQQRAGGWPLTMFLTPDGQVPFFGGTYFPPSARHGLPAFIDVLDRVAEFYRTRGPEVTREGNAIVAALERLDQVSDVGDRSAAALDADPIGAAQAVMQSNFDVRHGGFGSAPKFPHAGMLEFLLDGWVSSLAAADEDEALRHMTCYTLERMGLGGLYDHLGGGFFRYSVDDSWMIPHFEKMLYDNAALLALYARAAQLARDQRFEHIVRETAGWLMREMQSPDGGYFATLDADSEGSEGAYYLWDAQQVARLLVDPATRAAFEQTYGLDRSPNFEDKWHLQRVTEPEEVAERSGQTPEALEQRLAAARTTLVAARHERPAPARDDKVLTGWNGLAIRGMATAALHLNEAQWADSASRAVDFIVARLWRDGRLLPWHKDGRHGLGGYLDDYAFLGLGLLALLEVRWRASDLALASGLADALLAHFEDRDRGGFYFTAHDHEQLIHRPKPFEDDSTPAGNGAAVQLLARLGHLLGRPDYLEAAERTLRAGWQRLESHPQACSALLTGLRHFITPPPVVIVRADARAWQAWRTQWMAHDRWQTFAAASYFVIPPDADDGDLPAGLRGKTATDSVVTAYVCRGVTCQAPASTVEELLAALERTASPG
jgi:uncharacterized protein YyaL (SSP411 family)